jgi:serine/threonine protein kinase
MMVANSTKLSPYEILQPIGAGGMGQVWKARDTRLNRTFAIKVLTPEFASRPDWKQRNWLRCPLSPGSAQIMLIISLLRQTAWPFRMPVGYLLVRMRKLKHGSFAAMWASDRRLRIRACTPQSRGEI